MTIFMQIIRELGTSVDVQGRNIQWFLDSFAASLQAVSFIRIVKVVCCPSICRSVLQLLILASYHVSSSYTGKSCVCGSLGKVCQTKNHCLSSDTNHSSRLVTSPTVNSPELLCQYSCGHELNTEPPLEFGIEKDVDWIYIRTEKDVNFRSYISADSELGRCSICSFKHIVG